ncbi:MAG: hypothetical protein ACJAQ0_001589 [Dasania sp.]|jgi:hypothetical protein
MPCFRPVDKSVDNFGDKNNLSPYFHNIAEKKRNPTLYPQNDETVDKMWIKTYPHFVHRLIHRHK